MTESPLRLLLVEDDPADARLVELTLEKTGLPVGELSRATYLSEAIGRLSHGGVDVVLLDLRLPDSQGLATLSALRHAAPEVPVVILTAFGGEAFALGTVRLGAQEYLPKEELDARSLERTIRFALEREQREQRAGFILRAIETLATTLDYRMTLRSLAHLAVPGLADWCVIELLGEDGRVCVTEIVASDKRKQALLETKLAAYAHGRPGGRHPVDEVLRSGESRLCAVVDEASRQRITYDETHLRLLRRLDPRSMLVVPLSAGDRILGALSLTASESGRRYGAEDQAIAEELARGGALAVANSQLYQESQHARQRAEELAARSQRLESVSSALAEALTPRQVAAVAMTIGMEVVGGAAGAVLLLDETGSALELLRAAGLPEAVLASWARIPLETDSPLTDALRLRQPVVLPDHACVAERYPEFAEVLSATGTGALSAVPLMTDAAVLGVVVSLFREPHTLSRTGEEFLLQCIGRCAAALERAMLFAREQRAKQEARSATQARNDVLAIVAHDLRNPLTAIATYAAMLHDHELPLAQREQATSAILASTRQMDKLIRDLLDVSRLEAGLLALSVTALEPAPLLRQAAELVAPLAEEKGLALQLDTPAELPALRADADRVLQVLSNLLGNALKFTPAGGRIDIQAEVLDREVLFLVSDTGPGIAFEEQPHLFDRFWQARHQRRGGAGLGLSIAKSIVELHGGRIGVESKPDAGSTFFFTLPVAAAAAPPEPEESIPAGDPEPAPEATATPARPVRVFLVDDHPIVRRGLKEQLRRAGGYEVVGEATSGEEAVRLAPLLRPDLVLMDLALPGMSGIDAMRELTRRGGDLKVLALTAEAEEDTLLPVLEAGGSGFVRKPTAHEDLLPAMQAALRDEVFLYPSGNRLLLRKFRLRREGHEDPLLESLTEHERQVVTLAAEGFTSAEIGKKLFLSPRTVDSYRSRAMRKLGLGSRAELVHFALKADLLTAE